MENSIILDLIEDAYFDKWTNEIKKADEGKHYETMLKNRQLLKEKFKDENKKIVDNYTYSLEIYQDIKLYKMFTKILSIGIKIGIDVQKILSEN